MWWESHPTLAGPARPFLAVRGLSSEDAQACLCITSQIPVDMGRSIWRIDMNLSKLQEIVEDRGAWHAGVHRVAKSQTRLRGWTTTIPEDSNRTKEYMKLRHQSLGDSSGLGIQLWHVHTMDSYIGGKRKNRLTCKGMIISQTYNAEWKHLLMKVQII